MFNVCVARFDVTENFKNFAKFLGTKQPQALTVGFKISTVHDAGR